MAGERFLKDYSKCLCCPASRPETLITRDHIIPRGVGKIHKRILGEIVINPRNKAPVCWPHHRQIDRAKFGAYYRDGVTGLVVFMPKYPEGVEDEMRLRQWAQFDFLLTGIAESIGRLNGDTPRWRRADYHKAEDLALLGASEFRARLISAGFTKNPTFDANPVFDLPGDQSNSC